MVVVVVVMVVVAMVMRPTYPPISEKLWYLAGRARNLPRHDEEGNIVGARARKPRGTHRINFHPFFLVGWGGGKVISTMRSPSCTRISDDVDNVSTRPSLI